MGSTVLGYQRTSGGEGAGTLQALSWGAPCAPTSSALGFVQLETHVASKQQRVQGTVSVRPQQEGRMNGFRKISIIL